MDDYIRREAAKALIRMTFPRIEDRVAINCVLNDVPAADVEEVRHGWWISVEADVRFRCSLCDCEVSTSWDYEQDGMFDYCPCCGAKMDGGADDE